MMNTFLNGCPTSGADLDGLSQTGVFESFRSYEGSFWRLEDHWIRWQHSAKLCGFPLPLEFTDLVKVLSELPDSDLKIKCGSGGTNWWLKAEPLPIVDFPEGVVITDDTFTRTTAQAKHLEHPYEFFQQIADENKSFEVIGFDQDNFLQEGNITNVFMIKDGQLKTPPSDHILPGLMRQWVIDQGGVIEAQISRAELAQADHIFLTNMVRGIIPVRSWQDWKSSDFEVTQNWQKKLQKNIQTEAKTISDLSQI